MIWRRSTALSFFLALAALAVLVALPAAADAAGSGSPVMGPVSGIVPPVTTSPSPFAPSNTAGVSNLTYHGGTVMRTNTVYAIYWLPAGSTVSGAYQATLDKYFQDVADSSGATDDAYSNDTQYHDNTGPIAHSTTFGGSYVDTDNAIPMNSDCAAAYGGATLTGCVTGADEAAEIDRAIAAAGWTPSATKEFFLFTPQGVGSCFSAGYSCAYYYYCAYHSSYYSNGSSIIWANQPYPTKPAGAGGGSCDLGNHPNGDVADATINVVSHEHIESITNPYGGGWFDASGSEIGDKCAWNFGGSLGSTGSGSYNEVLGTGKYWLQQEWSNATSSCVQRPTILPKVTAVSPASARVGDAVTLTGTAFSGASSVRFGTVDSTFTVDSPTQITAHVPESLTSAAAIKVTTLSGTATGPTVGLRPTLDSLTTTTGTAGDALTLTGKTLNGTTKVTFGASTATATIVSVTSTQVQVKVPASAVSGPITVTNAGGSTSTEETFRVVPHVTLLSPVSGAAGAPVTITGTGLAGATVTFAGDVEATPTSDTATKIVVPVPPTAVPGPIAIDAPGGSVSTASFKPLPRLIAPEALKAGHDLSIAGTNLTGATALTLAGAALPLTVDSAVAVHTSIPSTAVTGTLAITTPNGTATTTLKVLPQLESFSPSTGTGGTSLTLTGVTLKSPTRVAFAGGATATIVSSTASSVTVTVPSGALNGAITVTTAGGSATTEDTFTMLPKVSLLTPASATAGTQVAITGAGLSGATSVSFGEVAADIVSVSATKVVAKVPATAVSAAISVTTPTGTATSPTAFKPLPKLVAPDVVDPGDDLTLAGTNLLGATKLTLNGVALDFTPDTALQVETTVPDPAANGPLTITTPAGTSTVTLRVRPTLESFSPDSGKAGATVTLTGTVLKSPTKVTFGTVSATIVASTATTVTVKVPTTAVTAAVTVTTIAGSVTSERSFTVLPTATTFSPLSGAAGALVKVKGSGMAGVTGVTFGGVSAVTVTHVSATEVDAIVPEGASTGQIQVLGPAESTSTTTGSFTVTGGASPATAKAAAGPFAARS